MTPSEAVPEGLFPALMESAPDALVIVDDEARIVLVNQQAERMFGYGRDAMVGRHVELLIPDRFRERHVGHRDRYISDPHPRPMGEGLELFGRRQDGSDFPVEISLSPIELEGRRWVAAAIRDVTSRKEAEKEVREAQGLFEALLEAAPDAMVIVDGDGKILLVNEQAEKMFGHDRKSMVGRPVEILIPQRFASQHVGHRSNYQQDPRSRPMGQGLELFGMRADGSEFPLEISLSPVKQAGQRMVIAAVRDITSRKEMERKDREARRAHTEMERLRERDSFKTQFINNAAHELNTPLTPLLMQLKILEVEGEENLTDGQRMSVNAIRRNGERFARLVQDLLDVGRYQGGRLSLEMQDVDLAGLVRDVASDFEASFAEQGAPLRVEAEDEAIVHGDPVRLRQVLDNLVSNAYKYGQGRPVRLSLSRREGRAVVEVQDQGHGLTKEQIGRLFEPFSRVLDAPEAPPGTGLGLYLSQALAEMHGGRVDVASDGEGTGATFTLSLPLRG